MRRFLHQIGAAGALGGLVAAVFAALLLGFWWLNVGVLIGGAAPVVGLERTTVSLARGETAVIGRRELLQPGRFDFAELRHVALTRGADGALSLRNVARERRLWLEYQNGSSGFSARWALAAGDRIRASGMNLVIDEAASGRLRMTLTGSGAPREILIARGAGGMDVRVAGEALKVCAPPSTTDKIRQFVTGFIAADERGEEKVLNLGGRLNCAVRTERYVAVDRLPFRGFAVTARGDRFFFAPGDPMDAPRPSAVFTRAGKDTADFQGIDWAFDPPGDALLGHMIIGRTRYRVELGPEAQSRLPVSFIPVSKAHRLPAAEAGELVAAATTPSVTVAPTPTRQPLAQGELGPSLRLMNGGERIVRLAAILGIALAAALSMLAELRGAWRNRALVGGSLSVIIRLGLMGATALLVLAPEIGFALGRGGFGMLTETRATILAYGLASLAILLTGRFGLAAMALWLSLLILSLLGSLTLISLGVDAEKTDFAIHAVKNKLLFIDILPVAAVAVALVSDRAIQALPRRFFAGSGKLDLMIRAVPAALILAAFVIWGAVGTETGVAGFQPVEIGKLALVLLLAGICVGFARIDLFYTRGQYAAWLLISLFTALVFFLLLTAVPFLKSDYSPVLIILSTAVILFFSFLLPTVLRRIGRVFGTLSRRRAAPQPRQRRLGWPRGGVLAGVLLALLALNAVLIAAFPKLAVFAIAGQWSLPTERGEAIDALERARDGSFRVPAERLLTWYDLDHNSLRPAVTDAGPRTPDVAHRDLGFQLLQSKVALAEMPCRMARLSSGLDQLPAETREPLAQIAGLLPDPCALSPDAPQKGIREPGETVPEGVARGYSVNDLIRLPVVQNDFIATYLLVRFGLPIGLWLVLAQVLLVLASIAIAWKLLGQRLNGVADETARHGLAVTAFGGAALFALHWSISWGNAIGVLPVMGQPMTFIAAATSHHLLMALPVSILLLMAGRVAAIRAVRVRRAPPAWGGAEDVRG